MLKNQPRVPVVDPLVDCSLRMRSMRPRKAGRADRCKSEAEFSSRYLMHDVLGCTIHMRGVHEIGQNSMSILVAFQKCGPIGVGAGGRPIRSSE